MSDYDFDGEYGVPDGEGMSIEEAAARLDRSTGDVGALRELVEQWRDNGNLRKPAWECADELEAVINDE